MNPKEKAQEMHLKFWKCMNATIAGASTIFKSMGRDAALIAVEEILKSNSTAYQLKKNVNSKAFQEYWEEVKKELESL